MTSPLRNPGHRPMYTSTPTASGPKTPGVHERRKHGSTPPLRRMRPLTQSPEVRLTLVRSWHQSSSKTRRSSTWRVGRNRLPKFLTSVANPGRDCRSRSTETSGTNVSCTWLLCYRSSSTETSGTNVSCTCLPLKLGPVAPPGRAAMRAARRASVPSAAPTKVLLTLSVAWRCRWARSYPSPNQKSKPLRQLQSPGSSPRSGSGR